MGCQCGKGAKPTGFGTSIQDAQRQAANEQLAADAKKSRTQSFALKTTSGKTMSFGSKLQRDAWQRRNGGTLA